MINEFKWPVESVAGLGTTTGVWVAVVTCRHYQITHRRLVGGGVGGKRGGWRGLGVPLH